MITGSLLIALGVIFLLFTRDLFYSLLDRYEDKLPQLREWSSKKIELLIYLIRIAGLTVVILVILQIMKKVAGSAPVIFLTLPFVIAISIILAFREAGAKGRIFLLIVIALLLILPSLFSVHLIRQTCVLGTIALASGCLIYLVIWRGYFRQGDY